MPKAGEPGPGRRCTLGKMNAKLPGQPSGPRRARHGRGRRGPLIPMHLPGYRSRPERFDDAVMASAQRLADLWPGRIEPIEFRILPVPSDRLLDLAQAAGDRVPLASSRPATAQRRARITLYRSPLEQLAKNQVDLVDLVHQSIVHEVAELWASSRQEIDPDYFGDDPQD